MNSEKGASFIVAPHHGGGTLEGYHAVLAGWTNAVRVISEQVPPRTTVRQILAFAYVAQAHAAGRRVTVTDMRMLAGEAGEGTGAIGVSIARTYQVFLPPTKKEPDALGWMTQEADEDDRRKRYLVLTILGAQMAGRVLEALRPAVSETQ
ncbi:MAG: hypothetical protein ACXW36_02000 [Nitrospira sp.]